MREDVERLLELQNWDLETLRLEGELNSAAPLRADFVEKVLNSRQALDALKQKCRQVEVDRKGVEAQIVQLQGQVDKYAGQQLLTRKNDEYRAFQSQINTNKKTIGELETKVLEFMDKEDAARRAYQEAQKQNVALEADCKTHIKALDDLKTLHTKELRERREVRTKLAAKVSKALCSRYQRMFKNKGGHVLVGIDDGACGGCHIKLTTQEVLSCRSDEPVECINCGRMLYYSSEMKLDLPD